MSCKTKCRHVLPSSFVNTVHWSSFKVLSLGGLQLCNFGPSSPSSTKSSFRFRLSWSPVNAWLRSSSLLLLSTMARAAFDFTSNVSFWLSSETAPLLLRLETDHQCRLLFPILLSPDPASAATFSLTTECFSSSPTCSMSSACRSLLETSFRFFVCSPPCQMRMEALMAGRI